MILSQKNLPNACQNTTHQTYFTSPLHKKTQQHGTYGIFFVTLGAFNPTDMTPFVHLHVHSQYSVLDGQAAVTSLVDKAIADGMPGVALTDHGTMYGIKEFTNYIKKKNGKTKDAIKEAQEAARKAREEGDEAAATEAEAKAEALSHKFFKPIIGCEVYVAMKDLHEHVDRSDIGRHLILLAQSEKG